MIATPSRVRPAPPRVRPFSNGWAAMDPDSLSAAEPARPLLYDPASATLRARFRRFRLPAFCWIVPVADRSEPSAPTQGWHTAPISYRSSWRALRRRQRPAVQTTHRGVELLVAPCLGRGTDRRPSA